MKNSELMQVTKNKEVVYASFILRDNGLEPIGVPDFEQWLECGAFIRKAKGAVHFWIGDWLNYGENQWGEKYLEAIETTGYDYQTLRNDKWVAARIDLSRRRDKLSFDHHVTIADLEPDEQDRLLVEAEEKKLDSKSFRTYVNEQQFGYKPQVSEKRKEQRAEDIIHINGELLEILKNYNFDTLTSKERGLLLFLLNETREAIEAILVRYNSEKHAKY